MKLDPLLYDVQFDSETGEMSFYDKAGGLLYSCVVERGNPQPLTLEALEDGSTVRLRAVGTDHPVYQTSLDGGTTWNDYSVTDATPITLNTGEKVCFRSKTPRTSAQTPSKYVWFLMTGKISASGNCYSMITPRFKSVTNLTQVPDASGGTFAAEYGLYRLFDGRASLVKAPELPATTLASNCYYEMFKGCTSLTQAPALPATTLASSCYSDMFSGCTSLTQAPALPATTLADRCYHQMFYGCTSLVQAPELPALSIPDSSLIGRSVYGCYVSMFEGCTSLVQAPALPATTLGKGCYVSMFRNCTSLVQAPALPATTLPEVLNSSGTSLPAFGCYSDMFSGCTSLVQAPALPSTTLGGACYGFMFYGCTSLTQAPALPATTLPFYCYAGMFYECTSLEEIRVSATDISAKLCTVNWTFRVSATGDFYADPSTEWSTGVSGIPENWNRIDIAELEA